MSLRTVLRAALLAALFIALLPLASADKVPSRPAATTAASAEVAPPPPAAAKPDAEGFVPESLPPIMVKVDESMPAAPLVATAYGFIWLAVFAFVLFTLSRVRRLEAEISELGQRIRAAK
jgi:CcmD family protein